MNVAIKTEHLTVNHSRTGVWVALASMVMLFTSLSSAYIVRSASSFDWVPLRAPRVMFAGTACILLSSVALEYARRRLRHAFHEAYARYLLLTALLGIAFLTSQLLAWRQLARQGIYLATNPYGSFFYLLTAAHGVHLLGGLLALGFLWLRSRRQQSDDPDFVARRQARADAVAIYWHFMDGLWIYLFLLLFLWR